VRPPRSWLSLLLPCLLLPSAAQLGRPARSVGVRRLDDGLIERAREAVAASEYEVRANARGLQAPNRANGLRTYFAPAGVSLHDRANADAPPLLDLSLSGVGRSERLASVLPGEVTHDRARVEIHRPGLDEWYVNSPAGLEQGFTVEKRPEGEGDLVLELRFADATAVEDGGGAVLFHTATGRSLRCGALRAQDARDHPLTARFELAGADRLRLVVADAGAAYPLTVDPLLTGTFDTTFEGDETGGDLGVSVAIGDTDGDGYADVVIGADDYDAGQSGEGAVFLFDGGPSGIANAGPATADALLQGNQANASFGRSVATGDFNGDGYADVVISAPGYGSRGGVFIFPGGLFGLQDGNPGSAQTALLGTGSFRLGYDASCAGDVNRDGYDDLITTSSGEGGSGDVWIFLGGPAGIPSGLATSAATHLTSSDVYFGGTSAGAGDVNGDGFDDVIVGDVGPNSFTGAAYVFLGSASGIASGTSASAATTLTGSVAEEEFGVAASAADVNGDGYADVIVGAPTYGTSHNGAAYVFLGSPSGIASGSPAVAATALLSDASSANFGISVAAGDLNGDGYADVVIGASGYSGASASEGAAFVFLGGPSGVPSTTTLASAYARLTGSQASDGFGSALAVGDVNGDGYADVSIGAHLFGGTSSHEGAAYVSLGGSGYPSGFVPGATIETNQADADLGQTVVDAGDLNGDGFDDVAVGAPFYDLGETDEGIVLVFNGSANGLPAVLSQASASALIQGNQASLHLGTAIAGAGDVNGDGYGDLLVGAPALGSGGTALLYLGSATGIPASSSPANASAAVTSDLAGAGLGAVVAGIGDVNGDGFADIAIGAPNYDSLHGGGAVFVFDGSLAGIGSGSTVTASAKLVGGQAQIGFGSTLAGAGDVNGDGYSDLAVGVPEYSNGQESEGAVLVFQGSATGIASGSLASANTRIESNLANVSLGQGGGAGGIAGAGDFNGDGYDDLVIGDTELGAGGGGVLLYLGGPSGIPNGSVATASASSTSNGALGASVAGVGDINGDGLADVGVGAPLQVRSGHEGVAGLILGNSALVFLPGGVESPQSSPTFFSYALAGADVNGDGYSDLLVGAPLYSDPESEEGAVLLFYGSQLERGRTVRLRQRRADTASAQLAPLGRAVSLNGFSAELTASDPNGRGRVAATFQACPRGSAFGSASCVSTTTPFTLVGGSTPSALLATTFSTLAANTLYHWRARVLYADAAGAIPPNPAHGAWRRPGARAALEDLRTGVDTDGDGVPDAADNCPLVSNPGQEDTGGMGPGSAPDRIGDACQCGSVAGDGHVDTTDVAAYRAALANPTGAPLSADAQTRCRVLGRTGGCDIRQVTAIRRAIASPSLLPIQSGPAAQFCVAALGA